MWKLQFSSSSSSLPISFFFSLTQLENYMVYMNCPTYTCIKHLLYYSRCSFSGLELHVHYDWWVIALALHCGFFPIRRFVHRSTHISSITQKLWPPEVYQDWSMLIRSGTTGCRCDACAGVLESGCGNAQNVCFSFSLWSTQPHYQTPTFWKHSSYDRRLMAPNIHGKLFAIHYFLHFLNL